MSLTPSGARGGGAFVGGVAATRPWPRPPPLLRSGGTAPCWTRGQCPPGGLSSVPSAWGPHGRQGREQAARQGLVSAYVTVLLPPAPEDLSPRRTGRHAGPAHPPHPELSPRGLRPPPPPTRSGHVAAGARSPSCSCRVWRHRRPAPGSQPGLRSPSGKLPGSLWWGGLHPGSPKGAARAHGQGPGSCVAAPHGAG